MKDEEIANILQCFEPIRIEAMDNVSLMKRMDTKFAFHKKELLQIIPHLEKEYKVFEVEGTRMPTYKSVYFDSEELRFYKDHHNKKMSRFKVRKRKYVDSGICFLEVKHKFKGKTTKQRIPTENMQTTLSEEELQFVQSIVPGTLNLKESLWNSFQRITLVHKTDEERLTLDINLIFHIGEKIEKLNKLVIAELKQPKLDRNSTFFEIMKENDIRPYRLSKYCIGAIEIYGKEKVKYNRFKKKLRKLKEINDAA